MGLSTATVFTLVVIIYLLLFLVVYFVKLLTFFSKEGIKEGWEGGEMDASHPVNRSNHGREVAASAIAEGLAMEIGYLVLNSLTQGKLVYLCSRLSTWSKCGLKQCQQYLPPHVFT